MLGQHRSTQRKVPFGADDEEALTEDIIALARQYGRYGYRRVTALLHAAGWSVNHKRVERIWRREGLKVPQRQPKRGRLWLNDGSCIRLRPEYRDCQEFCAGGRLPSLDDEALTEDYGELTFGLTPFARWALPFVRRVIEHEI